MSAQKAYNNIYDSFENVLHTASKGYNRLRGPHKDIPHILNNRMSDMAMHAHFVSAAHNENKYDEASQHLENMQDALRALHQTAIEHTGEKSSLSKAYAETSPQFHAAADSYREAVGVHAPRLGQTFEGIMKNSKLNPNQFGK